MQISKACNNIKVSGDCFKVQCNVLFMSVFGVELPVKNEHFWALFNFSIIFFCLALLGILFL